MVAEEARELMAQLGFRRIADMIGRVDMLETEHAIAHWKKDGLDLSPILAPAQKPHPNVQVRCTMEQDHGLELALDNRLIDLAQPAIDRGERVEIELPIVNTNRTVGTMLSNRVVNGWGEQGLPPDTIHIKLRGSAGQSIGAFMCRGITLELEGDSNADVVDQFGAIFGVQMRALGFSNEGRIAPDGSERPNGAVDAARNDGGGLGEELATAITGATIGSGDNHAHAA